MRGGRTEAVLGQTPGLQHLDNFKLSDQDASRQAQGAASRSSPFSSFSWNEIVFASFQAGPQEARLRVLPSAQASRPRSGCIASSTSGFYHSSTLKFDLSEFAFEHIGLSRSYADSGKIKEKLQPAIEELTEAGFLEPMSREERYTKRRPGRVDNYLRPRPAEAPGRPNRSVPEGPEPSGLEKALIERGVTPATAAELVRGIRRGAHPAEDRSLRLARREEGQAGLEEPGRISRRLHPEGLHGPQGIRVEGRPGEAASRRGRRSGERSRRRSNGPKRQQGPRGGRAGEDRRPTGILSPSRSKSAPSGGPVEGQPVLPPAIPAEPEKPGRGRAVSEAHPRRPHHALLGEPGPGQATI